MWIEELPNGKFKYNERYKDLLTEKTKYVSVTLTSKSNQAKKQAQSILDEKIELKKVQQKQSDMTFEQLYNKWLPIYKQNVKRQTYRNAISAYKVVTEWFDSGAYVRNIKPYFIQKLLDDFYYSKGYSHSYSSVLKSFLSNIFEYGKSIGVVDTNVMREVKLRKTKKTIAAEQLITEKYLEPDELSLVLDEIKLWPKVPRKYRFAEGLELMSITGLRYGEMAALKNDDFDGNKLRIDETLFYDEGSIRAGITESPKNSYSNRTISLSNRAIEILTKWTKENEYNANVSVNYSDMGFIFCEVDGVPIHISPVNRILRNVREKLKKEGKLDKKISTHIFRHTHISQLAEMNIPIKTIMARVGHNDPKTTLRIYTHVTKKMESDLLEKLNAKEKGD